MGDGKVDSGADRAISPESDIAGGGLPAFLFGVTRGISEELDARHILRRMGGEHDPHNQTVNPVRRRLIKVLRSRRQSVSTWSERSQAHRINQAMAGNRCRHFGLRASKPS